MTKKHSIKTYDTESYRDKYIRSGQKVDSMLKSDFGKFFMVKVEEMILLMKLPVPPARTTNHTIIYLTEGEAVMNIGSETYKIFKDECLIVPAGQVFSFRNIDINKGYLCSFHDDFVVGKFGKSDLLKDFEFLRIWGNPEIRLNEPTSGFVNNLFKRILEEYATNGIQNQDIIQSYMLALLCEINHVYKPISNIPYSAASILTNRFKELISSNIRTKHRVTDYALLLNVSPNHLNKSVKAITGKSSSKWIDETIVLESKVLLHQSNLTINEIAIEVGHYDQSYFSRLFKKYEGVTPQEFRKMIEKS
ncbi:AraC family transcriptional regulator [Pseudarcicella hirudinis]|nr:AraC family transcriptional regulator [Pseudarcicella hirudinis]